MTHAGNSRHGNSWYADNDRRLAKAANNAMLKKLHREAQKESKSLKKKVQQEQGSRGTKQKVKREAWASDEEDFKEALPRADSGQQGQDCPNQAFNYLLVPSASKQL